MTPERAAAIARLEASRAQWRRALAPRPGAQVVSALMPLLSSALALGMRHLSAHLAARLAARKAGQP